MGQLFFDMSLIEEVMGVSPYNDNKNPLTTNDRDSIFKDTTGAVKGYDGLMEVRKLGQNVEDGLIAWISIGIDSGSSAGGNSGNGGKTSAAGTVGLPGVFSRSNFLSGAD